MERLKDESGQTMAVFAAFMGLIALGFLAFALDAGMLFHKRRMAQSAADAAAYAAASEIAAGDAANEQTIAEAAAKLNGFDASLTVNPAHVVLSTPASGNFTTGYVQATVYQPTPTFFLGAFSSGRSTVTVGAQAIAGGSNSSPTCVCLEGTSGMDLNMSNDSKLVANSCGVVDNSNSGNAVGIVGSAELTALTLGTISTTWDNSSNINNGGSIASSTKIALGISNGCAPQMPAVPTYSSCANDPGGSSNSFTAGPSSASGVTCYKALTVGANGSLDTLNPGTYVITIGPLHFESGSGGKSNAGGNGVFFYLTGTASLLIDNGANVNLVAGGMTTSGGGTAPTVGSYNGILIYQDPSDTAEVSVQGGSTAYLAGSLFAPSAKVILGNGSGTHVNMGIVAQTLTMNGGGTLDASATSSQGSSSISSPKLVQ